MEYIIILLLIALLGAIYFKQPQKVLQALSKTVVSTLKEKEEEIIYGLYNKLPPEIKEKVNYNMIEQIVVFTIDVVSDILRDENKSKA